MRVEDLPLTPPRLRHVSGRLGLDEPAYARAKALAGFTPDVHRWRHLIDRFFLIFGVALIVAGVAAFFASNWSDLHRFWKLAIVEAGIAGCVAAAWLKGLDTAPGRSAHFAAAFLVGVLFAVYGQIYQTGADPYGLFLVWAVFVAGWAAIGRQAGLWLLLLVLVNLSFILYWTQVLDPRGASALGGVAGPLAGLSATFVDATLASLVFALNGAALVVWEVWARRGVRWMRGRTFPRLVSTLAAAPVLVSGLILILASGFDEVDGWNVLGVALFLGFAATSLVFYRTRVRDLFILTLALLGGILLVTSVVGRMVGGSTELWLLLAALVVAQTAGAAYWLRGVAQGWEDDS